MLGWLWRRMEVLAGRRAPGARASIMTSQALAYLVLVSTATTFAQTSKPNWAINVSRFEKATPGSNVILLCTLTHPITNYTGNITTIWKKEGSSFLQCSIRKTESSCSKGGGGRYHLIGDPKKGDHSLKITNVSIEDSSSYQCRIELDKKEDAYENKPRTLLLVSEEDPCKCQCLPTNQSLDLPIAFGVLSALLLVALLGVVGFVLWSRRGKESMEPSENKKVHEAPPTIPLETSSTVGIYENIPRGTNTRLKKSLV